MMYEDLVRDLRHDGNIILKCGSPIFKVKQGQMMVDAADAIEKLAEFAEQFEEGRFYLIRDGVLYKLKPNPPFPPGAKTWTLPPIEIKEDEDDA